MSARARFNTLRDARDGVAILALVRELAGNGPEAYGEIAEILEWLQALKSVEDYGLEFMVAERAFDSVKLRPFAEWGVRRRGELTIGLRTRLAQNLLLGDAGDDNRLVLELLTGEDDVEFCNGISWCLSRPSADEVPGFVRAAQAHLHHPDVAGALMFTMAQNPTPEAIAFLAGHAASADPAIAQHARMAHRLAAPPVAGVLVVSRECGSCGLRPGDIVVSWNGRPLRETKAFWEELAATWETKATATVEVERDGKIERIEVTSPPGLDARSVDPSGAPR